MISDQQLETAARRYCELAKLNPEEMVPIPSNSTLAMYEQRWKRVAASLKTQWLINEALGFATRAQ